MGAGILPTCIHNGKLFFLFGKENKYEVSAPGFSDFGGGSENNENYMETAIREAEEESTGFFGSFKEIETMLKKYGTYNIDYNKYRVHIFKFEYDDMLPLYYNRNQKFLQKRLDPELIKNSKIFEKVEIKWVCIDDLNKMKPRFRNYFRNIVDIIIDEKDNINKFICKNNKKIIPNVKGSKRNKSKKNINK